MKTQKIVWAAIAALSMQAGLARANPLQDLFGQIREWIDGPVETGPFLGHPACERAAAWREAPPPVSEALEALKPCAEAIASGRNFHLALKECKVQGAVGVCFMQDPYSFYTRAGERFSKALSGKRLMGYPVEVVVIVPRLMPPGPASSSGGEPVNGGL